jgi:hypothetical protein
MPGPLPRWLTGCAYPFLPLSHRPSPFRYWVGSTTTVRSTTSERRLLTRLQSFVNLQASEFAATQVVPTAGIQSGCQGGRGVYIRAERGSLPPRASDMLAVRNRAIDGRGLPPPRSAALLAAPTKRDDARFCSTCWFPADSGTTRYVARFHSPVAAWPNAKAASADCCCLRNPL